MRPRAHMRYGGAWVGEACHLAKTNIPLTVVGFFQSCWTPQIIPHRNTSCGLGCSLRMRFCWPVSSVFVTAVLVILTQTITLIFIVCFFTTIYRTICTKRLIALYFGPDGYDTGQLLCVGLRRVLLERHFRMVCRICARVRKQSSLSRISSGTRCAIVIVAIALIPKNEDPHIDEAVLLS